MNRILLILFLLITSNYCFGQSDTTIQKDSIYFVIDGVITNGNTFGAEYGTVMTRCNPNVTFKDSTEGSSKDNYHNLRKMNDTQKLYIVDGLVMPYSWYITHSIGFAPEESEPVFYVAVSKKVTKSLFLGLKGGVYTFEADLDRAVNDTIQTHAPYPSPGTFTLTTDYITQGLSYIGAIHSTYELSKSFSVNGSAGIRLYSEKRWDGEVSFSIPSSNYTPPELNVTPSMNLRMLSSESIIKPYFSLGANYRTEKFEFGVFADNILSFGINLGMGFN